MSFMGACGSFAHCSGIEALWTKCGDSWTSPLRDFARNDTLLTAEDLNIDQSKTLALKAELFDLVVIVLPVENIPLLRAFEDDLALRSYLLAGSCVDLCLLVEEFFERLAGLLADGVAVLEEVDLGNISKEIGRASCRERV